METIGDYVNVAWKMRLNWHVVDEGYPALPPMERLLRLTAANQANESIVFAAITPANENLNYCRLGIDLEQDWSFHPALSKRLVEGLGKFYSNLEREVVEDLRGFDRAQGNGGRVYTVTESSVRALIHHEELPRLRAVIDEVFAEMGANDLCVNE